MDRRQASTGTRALFLAFVALISLLMLYGVFMLYLASQAMIALLVLMITVGFAVIFSAPRLYTQRFIFPGIAVILLFIALPVGYTIYLGFTNYSSFNLLSLERVTEVHLEKGSLTRILSAPFN